MTARERFDEAAKAGWDADDEPPRNEDAEALMTMLDCPDVYGHRDDITRWFNERSQATAVLSSEPPSDPERLEREAGRLIVESACIRAERLGPNDAHELRHLWAAINAGNSDPCGPNGEACHLDAEAIRRWSEHYPKVVGWGARLNDTAPETSDPASAMQRAMYSGKEPRPRYTGSVEMVSRAEHADDPEVMGEPNGQ